MSVNKQLTDKKENVKIELTEKQLQAIHRVLEKGERVELIPNKDGVRVLEVKRRNVKTS